MEQFSEYLLSALSLIFVFVAVGFCILSHELGHFLAGKMLGLHIDAFSLGFKPFWKKKINGVEYRIGYLPFGGYVELPQIDATDSVPKAADGHELPKARPVDRIITAVAGPLFNILSGLLIGCAVWYVGLPQDTPKMREIVVLEVDPAGPEYAAGLRANDKIVKLNNERFFNTWMQFINQMLFTIGEVELGVERNGEYRTVRYTPKANPNAPASKAEGIAWPYFTPLIPLSLHPENGSIAQKAGIRTGDYLVAINGINISEFSDFQYHLDLSDGKPIVLTLRRGDATVEVTLTPEPIRDLGEEFTRYQTGIRVGARPDGKPGAMLGGVVPGSPADLAGMKALDTITKINQTAVNAPADLIDVIQKSKGAPITLELLRDGKIVTVSLAAKKIVPHTIGVTISMTDHPSPWQQFMFTLDMSYKSLRGILTNLAHRVGLTQETSSLKPSHMSGPLGIGMVLYNSARHAPFIHAIHFVVIVSFALAIFNLLPLPVLDGGHIFFGLLEIVTRRTLPVGLVKVLSITFVTLLIALMVFVTFSDLRRLARQKFPDLLGDKTVNAEGAGNAK